MWWLCVAEGLWCVFTVCWLDRYRRVEVRSVMFKSHHGRVGLPLLLLTVDGGPLVLMRGSVLRLVWSSQGVSE